MTTEAVSPTDTRDVGHAWEWRDLLVLTDADRRGRNALALPFQNATVIEVGANEKISIEEEFDTVFFDRSSSDPQWLDNVAGTVAAGLRPGGYVIIALQHRDGAATATESADLAGLVWQGLAIVSGQPCAVLRAGETTKTASAAAGLLLATAETALQLAAQAAGRSTFGVDHAKTAITEQIEARRTSERTLLLHLDALVRELEQERRPDDGIALLRNVLRRSRAGRALLRVLRPVRRAAVRLRTVKPHGQTKLRALVRRLRSSPEIGK